MAELRREFHFVFGLRPQTEPFHVLHYLCLASCLAVNRPDAIHVHHRELPWGPWWERIRPALTLHRLPQRVDDFRPERYRDSREGQLIERLGLHYAHESDFVRLDALLQHGGVYADMDTLFVQRYPDRWFELDCAIGEERSPCERGRILRPSLCNAVLFARPGSRFIREWRRTMPDAFDGHWNHHSCAAAGALWARMPEAVEVLPTEYFYRYGATRAGLATLLEENDEPRPDLYSVHLWAHLWWDAQRTDFSPVSAEQIDADWLRRSDCTLARLARPFLDAA